MWNLIPWKRRDEDRGATPLAERPQVCAIELRRDLDSLFDRFFGNGRAPPRSDWPATGWGFNIDDKENEIVVRADTPGFELGDFNVEIVGNNLVLKAEHRQEEQKGNGRHYREGRMYRTVALPRGVETDKIDARYHNGVLEIHVPKGEEANGKRIAVKAS